MAIVLSNKMGSWELAKEASLEAQYPSSSHSFPIIPSRALNLPRTRGIGEAPIAFCHKKTEDTCCGRLLCLCCGVVMSDEP